jgi:hypothetical protein
MFALMEEHYAGITRENFNADLAEKHWVLEIIDPANGA